KTSGTISDCPFFATQPAIPSPILTLALASTSAAAPTAIAKYSSFFCSSTISSDQVSGRKYSAIFSIMVCRMESRSSDEVRALARSWKMVSSCDKRVGDVPAASGMLLVLVGRIPDYSFRVGGGAMNDSNQNL